MNHNAGDPLEGPAGVAVEVTSEHPATITSFFLHCPGQSPAWSDYCLAVVHLRPVEGVREPVINVPGATHEVLLFALDPDGKNGLALSTDPDSWGILTPLNLVYQVHLDSDAAAREMLCMCAQAIVNGALWAEPPLSGQIEPWRTVLLQTSAHLRGEAHGIGENPNYPQGGA